MIKRLQIPVTGQGLVSISTAVKKAFKETGRMDDGICTLFIQHTSASLLIQENYDPSAKADLESWLNRLVPEGDPIFTHVLEGPDDMPAHIKSALTATSLSIPFEAGELLLGTWQGVYLWEHRYGASVRTVILHC